MEGGPRILPTRGLLLTVPPKGDPKRGIRATQTRKYNMFKSRLSHLNLDLMLKVESVVCSPDTLFQISFGGR